VRTIFLLQNVDGGWFVRTGSSNGQKISTNESYSSRSSAVRAFCTEGRNQPYAGMVVIVEGQRPMVIRAGKALPPSDRETEDMQAARIKAALNFRKRTVQ
jgi:uncharacterized protein YegP (UPF0339 family)